MVDAREVIKSGLDYPHLLDLIGDDDDLVTAGVNSGEMIRVAFGCERYLDRQLADGELAAMTSVRAIAAVLATRTAR